MNKRLRGILLGSILLAGCVYEKTDPSLEKIPEGKAKSDIEIFSAILENAHPSLNLYISDKRFIFLVDSIEKSIDEPVTERELFNKINYIINEIGCSHTVTSLPAYIYDSLQNRSYFFPYPVKWIDDQLLVNAVESNLPQGTVIKSINGEPVKKILQSLCLYNTVDGFHRKMQQNLAAEDFSLEYFFRYGAKETFELEIEDTFGIVKKHYDNAINLAEWNNRNDGFKYYYDRTKVDYDLTMDPKRGFAYLRLATFDFEGTEREDAYINFCFNSFELLKHKKDIRSLIIDLRENPGGKLYNGFLLYSFLANKPFKEYEKVFSRIKKIPYTTYLDTDFANEDVPGIHEKLGTDFSDKKSNDFFSLQDSLIESWQPDGLRFNGDVYIITNSKVVSTASYFALLVKNSGRGKIIGEETMGGNNSGNGYSALKYVLPNSKIRFEFPYAHIIYNFKELSNTGHGLIPDYNMPDNYESFKKNTDRQLRFIIDTLILNNKSH